jgi:hypothetical protein
VLQAWLEEPVEMSLDFKPFCLKMAFSPLMSKETILAHIDREIENREKLKTERERGIAVETEYIDEENVNLQKAELLWGGICQIYTQTDDLRIAWLRDWRQSLEQELE